MEKLLQGQKRFSNSGEFWRPACHFTAPEGWLNDPNGLIFYKGYYHLFYQYNPKHSNWDSMHWGHAVSLDMLHWKDLPIALTPDQPYDASEEGGCFSGSAIEKDGRLYLFYSATVKKGEKVLQTQCMAYSDDGVHFTKYKDNPVIKVPPQGASDDFRDPKVFQENGIWYMVLGGSIGGALHAGDGRIFLYRSKNLVEWEYVGVVLASDGRLGTMFECPDMFEINGKWVITASPMYHSNSVKSLYCVGTMDFRTCTYTIETTGDLDHGFDFYAPQSFVDEVGNRIIIAWQNGWLWMPWCEDWGPTGQENWRGTLSIPRLVTLDSNNKICLEPIDLSSISKETEAHNNVKLQRERMIFQPNDPFCCQIKLQMTVSKVESKALTLRLLDDGEHYIEILLNLTEGLVILDKSNADLYCKGTMACPLSMVQAELEMRIIVDHSSVEVITDCGRACLTTNVYPNRNQTGYSIGVPYKEAVIDRIKVDTLVSIWE